MFTEYKNKIWFQLRVLTCQCNSKWINNFFHDGLDLQTREAMQTKCCLVYDKEIYSYIDAGKLSNISQASNELLSKHQSEITALVANAVGDIVDSAQHRACICETVKDVVEHEKASFKLTQTMQIKNLHKNAMIKINPIVIFGGRLPIVCLSAKSLIAEELCAINVDKINEELKKVSASNHISSTTAACSDYTSVNMIRCIHNVSSGVRDRTTKN